MREIKFRAWLKETKEMIQVYDISWDKEMINTEGAWRYFDEIELMQYTGLKDKNGVEIYEGDIVTHWYNDGVVRFGFHSTDSQDFYGSTAYGYYIEGDQHETTLSTYELEMIKDVEVIGNIYENPELLEVE